MFSDTWIVILSFPCIAWVAWIFISNHRRVLHPPLPPGPLGLPVVGSLPFLGPELHSYFADLSRTYGPLVTLRLGKKIGIVVASPSTAKEVLKDFDITFANRDITVAGRVATYGGFDIGWSPYGPQWRMLRKVCVREMLGPATLDAVYSLRRREIHRTMRYFEEWAGTEVNIGNQMFLTVMNVVTSMLWGGTVKAEERAKLGSDFHGVVAEVTELMGAPNVSDFFPVLERFDLQGIVKKMKGSVKKLDDIIETMIDRRRKIERTGACEVGDGKDFLQVLLELNETSTDSKTPFTMIHLKALVMDIIVGGTETTSNTLEFAMAEMMNKPEVMRRAQQELDTVLGGSSAPMEESHILHLPYLKAIVKETLRLHTALPLLIPHCPSESCIIGGYTIPKGSRIFVNVWAIHRDPSLWEDPLDFKPERFLDGRHDFNGNDFSYFPFGSGRRICAGIAMAERMLLYSLGSLLHYFDWKLPEGVEKVDLIEKFGITLKKRTPLLLIPSPRSSNLRGLDSS